VLHHRGHADENGDMTPVTDDVIDLFEQMDAIRREEGLTKPQLPKESLLPNKDLALRLLGPGGDWYTAAVRPYFISLVFADRAVEGFPASQRR
jgi:hypothetical protein